MAHFRELLGDTSAGIDAVQDNYALHELVHQRPEFSGWSVHEIMRFIYG